MLANKQPDRGLSWRALKLGLTQLSESLRPWSSLLGLRRIVT